MQKRTPTVQNSRTPNDRDYRGDLADEASASPDATVLLGDLVPVANVSTL
jgi:hypothetical protein